MTVRTPAREQLASISLETTLQAREERIRLLERLIGKYARLSGMFTSEEWVEIGRITGEIKR